MTPGELYFVVYIVVTILLCLAVTPQLSIITSRHNTSIKRVAILTIVVCLLWPLTLPVGLYLIIKDGGL